MIGLIGPLDSVKLACAVSESESWRSQLVARPYTRARDSVALAQELDQTCSVILLTGRVPYELVDAAHINAELQYISHSGADLYRCIARILIERDGKLPRVSLDSIDESVAADTFADLELPQPRTAGHLLTRSRTPIDTHDVVAFHLDEIRSGRTDAALTCLAEVASQLTDAGVDVWRVTHTKSTMRQSLQNAVLSDELHRSRASQPGVVLFEIAPGAVPGSTIYDRESARLHMQASLLEISRKNGARLSALEGDVFALTTNRGAIAAAIERRRAAHASLLDAPKIGISVRAGAGIGATYAHAEENARAALALSDAGRNTPVVFPDGHVDAGPDANHRQLERQDITDSYVKLGEKLNVGALAARRLVAALTRIGSDTLTARQLGEAYGIQTRSARRLLAALSDVGFAEEIGIRAKAQAGRPQTLHKVNLGALLRELEAGEHTQVR